MRLKADSKYQDILILADFSDGSWHATNFAMQFLHHEDSTVSILQTYKSPGWGHFTMRKLPYTLRKITNYELKQLKNRLLSNFPIRKSRVKTLSMEGELNSVLQFKPFFKTEYFITLGIYSSFLDSCNRQNNCLEELIDTTHHPLFILPGEFDKNPDKKISFVGNPDKIPSQLLIQQILKICKTTESSLEVLFVLNNGIQKVSNEVLNYYIENFKSVDYEIKQLHGETKCGGIKEHIRNKTKDLLVIENSN